MRTRLKHIKSVKKADGRVYYYHRHTRRRIKGEPGSPEFLASYQVASAPTGNIIPGTIRALIRDYKASGAFTALAPSTQSGYRRGLDLIADRFGTATMGTFEDRRIRGDIRKWQDALAGTVGAREADYAVTVLSRIIKIAYDEGKVSVNHAAGIGSIYNADRSDKIWEEHHITAFLQKASPEIALALHLALETGQRQKDLIALTWNNHRNGTLDLKQSKGGRRVVVPVTQLLARELDTARRGDSLSILLNSKGKPWTQSGLQSSWYKTSRAAGITDRTFHDLRGTAVSRMAENSCTGPEIAAVTGHSLESVEKILDTYLCRTEQMARNAIRKLEAGR